MVRDITNLLDRLKVIAPDATDDVLSFTEDLTDTIADRERLATENETLDKTWRERYRNRFYGNVDESDDEPTTPNDLNAQPDEPKKKTTFESLFE